MKRERIIGIIILSVAALISCFAIPPAEAASLRAIPSLTLEERWDSNVFNTTSNEKSDFVTRASPRLTLSIDAFQTTINIGGGFDAEKYAEHDILDRFGATTNIDLTTLQPLRFTPQFSVRPSFRYIVTRDAVRRNELTLSPEPGIPPSESVVTARTEVTETAGSLQMTYLITPNVDLGIGGGVVRREFTETVPGLFDSSSVSWNASLAYRINPRTTTGIYFDTSNNSFEHRPNSQVFSGGLSATYLLTDKFTLDARAGASLDRESIGVGSQTDDTWSPSGRLSIAYAAQDFRAILLGSYELAGGGSLGRTTKRSNVVLTLTDRFTPKWTWNLSGSWQTNRSTDDIVTEDLMTAGGMAGIAYQIVEWASIHLSGNVFQQWDNGLTGGDLNRYSVMLGVTLSNVFPIF